MNEIATRLQGLDLASGHGLPVRQRICRGLLAARLVLKMIGYTEIKFSNHDDGCDFIEMERGSTIISIKLTESSMTYAAGGAKSGFLSKETNCKFALAYFKPRHGQVVYGEIDSNGYVERLVVENVFKTLRLLGVDLENAPARQLGAESPVENNVAAMEALRTALGSHQPLFLRSSS